MSRDNFEKVWLQDSLARHAQSVAAQAIQQTGRALPCRVVAVDGEMVTVAFEVNAAPFTLPQITIPKAGSQWLRVPTQVGDLGMTMPADVYLGGVSGLGGGAATLVQRGNLTTLVFIPVTNTGWSAAPLANAPWINGPGGAVLSDTAQTAMVKATANELTFSAAGHTLTISSSGIVLDGITFGTHKHTGVQSGGGESGGPTN